MQNNQQIFKALAQLVSFPTISNTPTTEIAAHIAHYFESLGF